MLNSGEITIEKMHPTLMGWECHANEILASALCEYDIQQEFDDLGNVIR